MNSYEVILWLHVLVMGYWIGSDLVVNALTHYVTRSSSLPGPERKRLWDFLMDVDQHPRNALILSVPLGFTLAAQTGLVWLDNAALATLWIAIRGLVRLHVGGPLEALGGFGPDTSEM